MKNKNEKTTILFNGHRVTMDGSQEQTWEQLLRKYAAERVGKLDHLVELSDDDAAKAVALSFANCSDMQKSVITARFLDRKTFGVIADDMNTTIACVANAFALGIKNLAQNFAVLNFGEWELARRERVEADQKRKAEEAFRLEWVHRLKQRVLDGSFFTWPEWPDVREEAKAVEDAISGLSCNLRESLLGFYRDGKTPEQLAKELGIARQTVYSYCNERGLFYLSRSKMVAKYIKPKAERPTKPGKAKVG